MRFDLTNPRSRRPAGLARLPRIVRLYIMHALIGFVLAGVFTGLVLGLDVAGIGNLVTTVQSGWLAALVFFTLNGIVFAGARTGIAVMGLGGAERRQGEPIPVRVRAD